MAPGPLSGPPSASPALTDPPSPPAADAEDAPLDADDDGALGPGPSKARRALLRLLVLAGFLLFLVLLARVSGLSEVISVAWLRERMSDAGPWGVLLLLCAFPLGLMMQLPGLLFAAAAILCYGPWAGGLLAYLGGTFAVSVVFVIVRAAGGKALEELDRPWVKRALDHMEEHPIRTVALLRLVFWTSPQLNYLFALSNLRFVPHLLGTLLGLIPIKLTVVLLFDRVLAYVGG